MKTLPSFQENHNNTMAELTFDICFPNWQRFETKVDRSSGPDACHPHLTAGGHPDGYGAFKVQVNGAMKTVGMHRVAYVLATGDSLDSDDYIDHVVCGNPRCCNPRHLRKTDAVGNARARKPSSRWNRRSGRRLFTDDEVMDYRRRWAAGEPLSSLSAGSGVRGSTIRKIVLGRSYKDLPVLRRPSTFTPRKPGQLLTEIQVAAIKARLLNGESQAAIARDYGVSRYVVNAIARGRTWAHVEPAVSGQGLHLAAD